MQCIRAYWINLAQKCLSSALQDFILDSSQMFIHPRQQQSRSMLKRGGEKQASKHISPKIWSRGELICWWWGEDWDANGLQRFLRVCRQQQQRHRGACWLLWWLLWLGRRCRVGGWRPSWAKQDYLIGAKVLKAPAWCCLKFCSSSLSCSRWTNCAHCVSWLL